MTTARWTPSGTPGEIYESHMVPAIFARWAPYLIDHVGVRMGDRVLDVACGTGAVTRLLADHVGPRGRVVGLDLNPGMLAAARTVAVRPNLEWMEGSAQAMPLPDSAFDVVVCQQGLQFFPDKARALAEMHRVLAPGGRLGLAVWRSIDHCPGYLALQEILARRIGREKAMLPPFAFGDGEALRALVSQAGFRQVRIHVEIHSVRFHSAEHMVRAVVGGAPTMMGALADQGAGVLETIAAEVAEATRALADDDGWATPAASHIITASA